MITTVDVSTYDAVAEVTPGLEKISETVFGKRYSAGDPTTYAHTKSQLNISSGYLEAKSNTDGSNEGFLTSSNISSANSSQSQTISVEQTDSQTRGWGAAVENTSVANLGGAKLGFTVSIEVNGSSARTSTVGNEYSGTVKNLPSGSPSSYTYGWKLVSYNTKLNGKDTPVIGYMTNITSAPPKSVAQNISVSDITDKSAVINWEAGTRPADYYKLYKAYKVGTGYVVGNTLGTVSQNDDETYSFNLSGLNPSDETLYIIRSYSADETESVDSELITLKTLPENFSASISAA